jgi:3-oxoacyl-[acyl-carrier-protein] synthase II
MDERPVDFIHAHGTGTDINDATELVAIEESIGAIGQGGCPIYSHKGALGHSLGAAGLTAVALSCQVHRFGVVPPNVQTANPLPTRSGRIERGPVRRQVGRSLAIAAGFGGAAAVVALRS